MNRTMQPMLAHGLVSRAAKELLSGMPLNMPTTLMTM